MDTKLIMQEKLHSFSWNQHRETFFNTILNLKEQNVFCDVTLACGDVLFHAHRLILAMCSEFFSEILSTFPSHQSVVVVVPTVGPADLDALLTYVYQGEIRISEANLPSLMKAAQTLKIKGLCKTNNGMRRQEQPKRTECEEASPETHSRGRSDSHDSVTSVLPNLSPGDTAHKPHHFPDAEISVPTFPQVEVFIGDKEESLDMIYEDEVEENEKTAEDVWVEAEDMEEFDPLSLPVEFRCPPAFISSDPLSSTPDPEHTSPSDHEVNYLEDSCQEQYMTPSSTARNTTTGTTFRYTEAQKLQLLNDYRNYGPTKAARLMSERLGRKVNESSVRSVVKAFRRIQKSLRETDK